MYILVVGYFPLNNGLGKLPWQFKLHSNENAFEFVVLYLFLVSLLRPPPFLVFRYSVRWLIWIIPLHDSVLFSVYSLLRFNANTTSLTFEVHMYSHAYINVDIVCVISVKINGHTFLQWLVQMFHDKIDSKLLCDDWKFLMYAHIFWCWCVRYMLAHTLVERKSWFHSLF